MSTPERISVILPIYNVERYLPRCIDSIITQSYNNLEIILIDDGSPDRCGMICDEYAAHDERIRVRHTSNGGVAAARRLGVEMASSDYIIFVDPDDWLPIDAIGDLHGAMRLDVDIVLGSVVRHVSDRREECQPLQSRDYTRHEYLKALLTHQINHAPWAKIYRKELFNQSCFYDVKRSQDFLMNIDIASRVGSVRAISKPVYFYRLESSSSTLNNFTFTPDYCCDFCEIISNILRRNNLYKELKTEYAIAAMHILYRSTHPRNGTPTNTPLIMEINDTLKNRQLALREQIILRTLNSKTMRCIIHLIVKPLRGFARRVTI